jgi:hypothetical protein
MGVVDDDCLAKLILLTIPVGLPKLGFAGAELSGDGRYRARKIDNWAVMSYVLFGCFHNDTWRYHSRQPGRPHDRNIRRPAHRMEWLLSSSTSTMTGLRGAGGPESGSRYGHR